MARAGKVLHHGDGVMVCTTAADVCYVGQPGCAADLLKGDVHLRELGFERGSAQRPRSNIVRAALVEGGLLGVARSVLPMSSCSDCRRCAVLRSAVGAACCVNAHGVTCLFCDCIRLHNWITEVCQLGAAQCNYIHSIRRHPSCFACLPLEAQQRMLAGMSHPNGVQPSGNHLLHGGPSIRQTGADHPCTWSWGSVPCGRAKCASLHPLLVVSQLQHRRLQGWATWLR